MVRARVGVVREMFRELCLDAAGGRAGLVRSLASVGRGSVCWAATLAFPLLLLLRAKSGQIRPNQAKTKQVRFGHVVQPDSASLTSLSPPELSQYSMAVSKPLREHQLPRYHS